MSLVTACLVIGLGLSICSTGLACSASGQAVFPSFIQPGPYDQISDRAWIEVAEACEHWDAGDLRLGRAGLRRIAADFPRHIHVGVLVQEIELQLLGYKVPLPDLGLTREILQEQGADGAAMLRRFYRDRADSSPSPESLVLAARLEPDLPAASSLLRRAIEMDPDCAWAHYGAAYVDFRAGRFRAAKEALNRAEELDPRLLPARRLSTRMLASSANADVAASSLDRWVSDAKLNPFVRPREIAEAEFDLALLLTQTEEFDRVEDLCSGLLEAGWVDSTSVYLVLAAARIADDQITLALDAARRASRTSPASSLAHIQRALILQDWMAEPARAFDAWARALEAASGANNDEFLDANERPKPSMIRDVQMWVLARTRLARLEALGVTGTGRDLDSK